MITRHEIKHSVLQCANQAVAIARLADGRCALPRECGIPDLLCRELDVVRARLGSNAHAGFARVADEGDRITRCDVDDVHACAELTGEADNERDGLEFRFNGA